MKYLPVIIVIGLALSLCNLADKLHGKKPSSSGSGSSSTEISAEHGEANAAQLAALSGGQPIKWDRQGMSWTVPPGWSEQSNEAKEFIWSSGGADHASLIVSISPMDESFPYQESIKAEYEGAKSRAKNGEVDEVKYVEIDGLTGVQFREANPEKPDGFRRLQWLSYRKFTGQLQGINVMLATNGRGFPKHQDALYGILFSMKITH
ncbi:MAG TPA: hypothetical protein VGQ39_01185 [Pyrinomonadaceae bacterium]|jgi:hypothetical protein|nr:hypothetical protein [Pyrinomonadaceae bacterium]